MTFIRPPIVQKHTPSLSLSLSRSMNMSGLHTLPIAYSRHLRGIGLETCILFAREGANVLMADISSPGLEKASAKLKQLIPSHLKVEVKVRMSSYLI